MKLGPRRILGVAAILVFGGYFIYLQTKPKRDPMILPSGVDLRQLPSPSATPPTPAPTPTAEPAQPVADPLTVGSQDARDDLYCSGVIYAAHRAIGGDLLAPEAQKRRESVIALAERGTAKLIAEGVATSATTASLADAQSLAAETDYAAGKLRIPEADCMARAAK